MKPKDLDSGIKLYESFHKFDPRSVGKFAESFYIPKHVHCIGSAVSVSYRSDKWDGKTKDYIHHHGWGVKIYSPRGHTADIAVPKWITEVKTLVKLGQCLGIEFNDGSKDIVEFEPPRPDLYAIPSGRALLIIESKRRVQILIWGGGLDVRPEGIVR